jgi:hypothetical protein
MYLMVFVQHYQKERTTTTISRIVIGAEPTKSITREPVVIVDFCTFSGAQ